MVVFRPTFKLGVALTLALALTAWSAATAAAAPTLRIAGNRVVTGAGAPLRIQGVNRSGSEYACAQGWGLFDGPTDDASIAAITSWGVNAVRVPLNEDCWLGINGVKAEYSGANYQTAIRGFVDRLEAHGLAVILDLHWGAPGSQLALGQEQAPDADHAPDFWASVAAQYKDVGGVAFDLFNEPHDISWSCWLSGCTTSGGWQATGMQQLINAVRGAGATQPVIAEGLAWGNDLSGWLAHQPSDPASQLAAGWHVYNFTGCGTTDCWNSTIAPVAQQVPVLATEVGEDDCAGGFLGQLLPWADQHQIGYVAWTWDTWDCKSGPSLISDYSGTPTGFGAAYKAYLAATAGQPPSAGPTGSPPGSTPPGSSPPGSNPPGSNPPTPGNPTSPPVRAPRPRDSAARFDFENGTTNGWRVRWGSTLHVSNETGTAWSGSHGLALSVSGRGWPAAGTGGALRRITEGTRVTYHVWAPAGVSAGASPMLLDRRWRAHVLPSRRLRSGWTTIRFTIPAGVSGARILGLQINDASGWKGRLALDDVSWKPPRH